MRKRIHAWAAGVGFCIAAGAMGCAEIPPCTVSPVDIEETREEVKIVEKNLVEARSRASELREELARKRAELNAKKDKPPELRKKVEKLQKGSGRHESQIKKKEAREKKKEEATS